jgi:hypothetical protein
MTKKDLAIIIITLSSIFLLGIGAIVIRSLLEGK